VGKIAPAFHADTSCHTGKGESGRQQRTAAPTSGGPANWLIVIAFHVGGSLRSCAAAFLARSRGVRGNNVMFVRCLRRNRRRFAQRTPENRRRPAAYWRAERDRTTRTFTPSLAANGLEPQQPVDARAIDRKSPAGRVGEPHLRRTYIYRLSSGALISLQQTLPAKSFPVSCHNFGFARLHRKMSVSSAGTVRACFRTWGWCQMNYLNHFGQRRSIGSKKRLLPAINLAGSLANLRRRKRSSPVGV
jgi:hypothetical protein